MALESVCNFCVCQRMEGYFEMQDVVKSMVRDGCFCPCISGHCPFKTHSNTMTDLKKKKISTILFGSSPKQISLSLVNLVNVVLVVTD